MKTIRWLLVARTIIANHDNVNIISWSQTNASLVRVRLPTGITVRPTIFFCCSHSMENDLISCVISWSEFHFFSSILFTLWLFQMKSIFTLPIQTYNFLLLFRYSNWKFQIGNQFQFHICVIPMTGIHLSTNYFCSFVQVKNAIKFEQNFLIFLTVVRPNSFLFQLRVVDDIEMISLKMMTCVIAFFQWGIRLINTKTLESNERVFFSFSFVKA